MDEFMIDPKENILTPIEIQNPVENIAKQIDTTYASPPEPSSFFWGGLLSILIIAVWFISKFDASTNKQYLEDIKNNIKETLLEYRDWINDWKDRSMYNRYVENGAFKATKYNTDYFSSIYSFFIGFL